MAKGKNNKYKIKVKDVMKSFQYWPRIFKLLWDINSQGLLRILFINILHGLTPIGILLATQELINTVTEKSNQDFSQVLLMFTYFVILSVFSEVVSNLKNYYESLFQPIMSYEINVRLMEKAVSLKLADFENSQIYDQLQRAQNEASFRPFQVVRSILNLISSTVTLLSSAIVLVMWKWWVAFVLVLIPLVSAGYFLQLGQREFVIQWKRTERNRKAWYYSFLMTRDITYKEVKLYQLGGYLVGKYKKIFESNFKVDSRVIKIRSIINFSFQTLNQLLGDVVVIFILFSAFKGEILIGNVVSYIRAVGLTESNSQGVLSIIFSMYQDNLYIKQLFSFLDIETEKRSSLPTPACLPLERIEEIEFKNVSFRYPGADYDALKNISFKISHGETLAIVGQNGSGKTTMVKLLTCLYEVDKGEILINKKSIKQFDVEDIRRKIGVVFQDFSRYELKVRENIGFGNLQELYDDEKILSATQQSGIEELITELPRGIDTQLGCWFSQGQQLSGGQWQKIAIARSFIRDASVYILDEPSAALDPIAEREVLQKLLQVTAGKICIFTSHRFSIMKHASQILVFNDGKIIEQGSHYKLMKLNKHYASLYNMQAAPYHECLG